jgi:uncharacterized membrane protein
MPVPQETESGGRRFRYATSVEIDAPIGEVFACWDRVEDFPRIMVYVRRTKRIDVHCVLWDVDVLGRQLVWEARVLENVLEKLVRWVSRWGAPNSGEVRFESLPGDRTRLDLDLSYQPRGFVERLGALLGVLDFHVRRDLVLFRRYVEGRSAQKSEPPSPGEASPRDGL